MSYCIDNAMLIPQTLYQLVVPARSYDDAYFFISLVARDNCKIGFGKRVSYRDIFPQCFIRIFSQTVTFVPLLACAQSRSLRENCLSFSFDLLSLFEYEILILRCNCFPSRSVTCLLIVFRLDFIGKKFIAFCSQIGHFVHCFIFSCSWQDHTNILPYILSVLLWFLFFLLGL